MSQGKEYEALQMDLLTKAQEMRKRAFHEGNRVRPEDFKDQIAYIRSYMASIEDFKKQLPVLLKDPENEVEYVRQFYQKLVASALEYMLAVHALVNQLSPREIHAQQPLLSEIASIFAERSSSESLPMIDTKGHQIAWMYHHDLQFMVTEYCLGNIPKALSGLHDLRIKIRSQLITDSDDQPKLDYSLELMAQDGALRNVLAKIHVELGQIQNSPDDLITALEYMKLAIQRDQDPQNLVDLCTQIEWYIDAFPVEKKSEIQTKCNEYKQYARRMIFKV